MTPMISVVLPVRNEAATLADLLQQLVEQDYRSDRFEIIVSDGMSTDATSDIARSFAQQSPVRTVLVENRGIRSSAGRNAGVAAATGDVIVFLDGHCYLPSRTLLRDTAALLESTHAACLCRPQPLLSPRATRTGRLIAAVRSSWLGHGRDSLIYDTQFAGAVDPASSGATYTRSALAQVGPYDERFDACEDVELNTRVREAGLLAYTHPSLTVYYEPRGTLRGLWKQMVRYGRGRMRLAAKHPASVSIAGLMPAAFVAWCIATLLVFLFAPRVGLWMLLPPLLFSGLTAVAAAQLADKRTQDAWLAPAVYWTIYGGLGWGWIAEFASLRWCVFRS